MKKYILFFVATAFLNNAMAQTTNDIIKQEVGQGVRQGATIATEHTADKVADKVLGKLFGGKKKKKESSTQSSSAPAGNANVTSNNTSMVATTSNNSPANSSSNTSLQTYSKYDFVPGEKVLVYEDFSQDAIGDFPENWNTNSSAQVVTISGQKGNWLMLNKRGLFLQEDIHSLPDNFTYEYDLGYSGDASDIQLYFVDGNNRDQLNRDIGQRSGVVLGIQFIERDKGGIAHIFTYQDGKNNIDNQVQFNNNGESKIKVSIWRQKQRMRVYLNQDKVLDLPRAFPAGKTYNTVMYSVWDFSPQAKYLISNIKLAVGDPDTRNKLITEGKFSTTGILFDVNSATVKPESYGTLKDIADVLQDNANVRVKIIGHTDSDGDASMNLSLSKKRAEAVKTLLTNEFKIDASRMETDGKGASDPVADNKTSAGKAQNRRVEFVKL